MVSHSDLVIAGIQRALILYQTNLFTSGEEEKFALTPQQLHPQVKQDIN
jgi:hypothetical protein